MKLVVLLYFIFFSLAASAETDDMDKFFSMSPSELANISITIASGTAKPAYQSAAVTSVITAAQIKVMGATELDQILETVPGLHVSIQAVTNDPVYTMRGIANNVNASVLFLLNGTRFSVPYKGSTMTGMALPVEAIQKIEVIRGPGSALYGADAFTGVVNIITKKANDINGTEIGIRGGSWDTLSAWGLHSEEWLGWDIATTLQFDHNNNDGNRIVKADAQTLFDISNGTSASLAPSEMQTKAERWNAHLNLQRKHWDIGFWAFNKINSGFKAGVANALDNEGRLDGENYLTDLRFSSEELIENWEFSVHASYLYTDIDAKIHNFPDGSILPVDADGNVNPVAPTGLVTFPKGMLSRVGIKNQVAELEISTVFKGIEHHLLRLSSGFRYERVDTQESRNYGKGIAIVGGGLVNVTDTEFVFFPDSSRTIWSVALQDEWQISSDWMITAGVRYDEYSDFGSTINPRFALVWDINDRLSSKLLYGRAFRAPSFLEQKQQNSPLFTGNPDLKPEMIETVEVAFDFRPVDELRIASNVYFYKISDLISEMSNRQGQTVRNIPGNIGYGTEFEWDWDIFKQLNLKGNYAWQYARNEETNRRVSHVPEHQIYTAVTWEFLPQWKIQTQLNWIGRRVNDKGDNRSLNDYETVDITLNSRQFFGHIGFSASVHNVFDSDGKEAAVLSYSNNHSIASRSFYLETNLRF